MKSRRRTFIGLLAFAGLHFSAPTRAETPVFELEIRNHLFYPSELAIPADTKIKLIVYNRDPSPEEFESYELNREKIIMGNSKGIVFIGPLPPGEYPFFGEFHMKTAQGKVIVQ
ncbi:MAG: cupredoxin domain-containing protein [Gammaproteobacteria bacterium]